MSYKCDNCDKGKKWGHMVSHAKNRLVRIFKPNLQKLKVLKNGVVVRVKFCTGCIKRLRKDGRIGSYALVKIGEAKIADVTIKSVMKSLEKETKVKKEKEALRQAQGKSEKAKETLDISTIVGKKS